MSYWHSKAFSRIYRRIQKFSQRHPKLNINVLEQAKKEFYALEDSLKMVGKPLSMQSSKQSEDNLITEDKPPAPPIEEDPIVHIGSMVMRESKYRELMQIQREKGTAPTTPPDMKLYAYLKSLFKNDK